MNNIGVQNLFSKGFPTNRIPITVPSTGQSIILRETTITELKSLCKVIIDNLGRKQMDVIYDAVSEYLQAMILTDGVDVNQLTEFDRLFCMMVFFQMSFFKEPITHKCQNCGVEIIYRYDMSKYLSKMTTAYVDEQEIEITNKNRLFKFTLNWPTIQTMSKLMKHFYNDIGVVTEEMEQTQFGINYILAFIKKITVVNVISNSNEFELDLEPLSWNERMDCINAIPSSVVFDQEEGLFSKITGLFINRLENCFEFDTCPQCHKETYYGLGQSTHFYLLFYGSLKSIYGYILQIECLLVFRYDCCIFDKEQYMTYNDIHSLIQQIGNTAEKENQERRKMGNEPLYKGLFYIREILNTMIFPQDKKH